MTNNPLSPSPPLHHGYSSEATAAVRLLSSVAVVGRDNEPIYLRGDLCDCTAMDESRVVSNENKNESTGEKNEESDPNRTLSGDGEGNEDDDDDNDDSSSPFNNNRSGKGLLGRFKNAVGRNSGNSQDFATKTRQVQLQHDADSGGVDDDGEEDPFGFFENNSNPLQSPGGNNNSASHIPAMSLTQQLVLHASLDRFEEMASRSNRGGTVRWRTPGSSNSANAMWMGLLCQVEERWNVYGYLTNTGIKFMILVENVYLNQDGCRHRQDHAPPSSLSLFVNDSLQSPFSTSGREADLKAMFDQLHELYVRHTMNPFSKLRSPIQSRIFDEGIVRMAQLFNSSALEKVMSFEGGYGGGSNRNNVLVWM